MRVLLSLLPPPGADDKATLDTEKLKEDVPRGLQKVELDLDDAVFLDVEEEKEEKAPPPPPPPPETQPQAPATTPLWKRPFVLAIVGGLLLFLLGGVAVYFLLPRTQTPPPPPQEAAPQAKAQKPKPEKPLTLHTIAFEPFVVEYAQDNATRFLIVRFSVSEIPDILEWEVRRKKIILRDAVYYYLHNKGLAFLNDPKNADKFKEDLLAVMNQYLGNGKIETLLIEEYVIR